MYRAVYAYALCVTAHPELYYRFRNAIKALGRPEELWQLSFTDMINRELVIRTTFDPSKSPGTLSCFYTAGDVIRQNECVMQRGSVWKIDGTFKSIYTGSYLYIHLLETIEPADIEEPPKPVEQGEQPSGDQTNERDCDRQDQTA